MRIVNRLIASVTKDIAKHSHIVRLVGGSEEVAARFARSSGLWYLGCLQWSLLLGRLSFDVAKALSIESVHVGDLVLHALPVVGVMQKLFVLCLGIFPKLSQKRHCARNPCSSDFGRWC